MSVKLTKGRHILFLLALCLTNIVVMHDCVVMPVANALYMAFPESVGGVNFILSGPALTMFVGSLVGPYLMKLSNKKTILSIACVIFTATSIFGAAIISLPYIIATRCLCGFCYGVVQVMTLDIVADYFVDENKRASFMGIYNSAMSAIGAVMGMAAGTFAVSNWTNAYLTYWAAVPMTLLVIFFVPNIKAAAQNLEYAQEETAAQKTPMGAKFWIALVNFMLFSIGYGPVMMMASVYIAENNLGNEALAGLANSLGTMCSCVFCLGFGFLYSKLKARTSMISFVLMTLGLLVMHFVPNKMAFLLVSGLCGGAYGMLFSYVYAHIPGIVAPENISRAISLLTAGTGLSMFAATYVVTGLMGFTSESTVTAVSLLLGIGLAAVTVVEFFNTGKMKENA